MTNENYRKCKTCRFCIHSDMIWLCTIRDERTQMENTCERYRPGSCENCRSLIVDQGVTACSRKGVRVDTLDVCTDYDPCGRRSI
ncbi:MAG: hypothetical protein KRP56_04815 [Candidatus Methanogranum gryphiswaldense]|nr:MAG: hypothetical protein KRP56_04815 [Candidatus Methanogranum sp. U3.2.1]